MPSVTYITENEVKSLLNWDTLVPSIEQVMSDVSSKTKIIQPARGFLIMPQKNGILLTMPGFSERNQVLACKLVTSFSDNPQNHNLPRILANITLFDPDTGKLKAVIEATTITEWRTAAASVVATKYLRSDVEENQVLTVLGAGRQGRIHIIAFQYFFKFKKVHLWNRTPDNAKILASELKQQFGLEVEIFETAADCTRHADVIVTATYSLKPLIQYADVKPNVLINAIGAGANHHSELGLSIYEKSSIYTDSMVNAKCELKGLEDQGYLLLGEIGEIINKQTKDFRSGIVVFHSLGMAAEDAAAAKLVFDDYLKRSN